MLNFETSLSRLRFEHMNYDGLFAQDQSFVARAGTGGDLREDVRVPFIEALVVSDACSYVDWSEMNRTARV
jgi:hypothetical protein